ncbi:MAG TPA: FkbM family methyltransferase [Pirellulales bacterium]|jgi:FkbM family methyltransferase
MKLKVYRDTFRRWWRYTRRLGPRTTLQYLIQRGSRDLLKFKIPGIPTPVYCRSKGPDFLVLYDLLGKKRCDYPFQNPPSLIIDAGAHVGYASLFYANRWPNAKIIALEPEAHNNELLHLNCSAYPNVTMVQGALWYERTQLRIINPEAQSWAFRVAGLSDQKQASRPVEAYTVSDLLKISGQSRASLLKIDIEGAELDVFANNPQPWLEKVDAILIELHDRFRPGSRQTFEEAVRSRQIERFRQGESDGVRLVA